MVTAQGDEAELEELRRRRLAQLQGQFQGGMDPAMVQAQQSEMERRQAEQHEVLRRLLTPEARERLARLRLTRPDLVSGVEQQILALASAGRLQRQVDDATLRALLERIQPEKREIRITRR
jgi:programmed cell death protein 5